LSGELRESTNDRYVRYAQRERLFASFGQFVGRRHRDRLLEDAVEFGKPMFCPKAVVMFTDVRGFTATASRMDPMELAEEQFADAFVRANLMANELLGAEILPSDPQNSAVDLLRSELRSSVLHLDNPHDLLARAEAFIEWSNTPKAIASKNAFPIEADFRQLTGLSWREYAAAAYAAFSRCTSVREARCVGRMSALFDLENGSSA
jgi:hypothetical protein